MQTETQNGTSGPPLHSKAETIIAMEGLIKTSVKVVTEKQSKIKELKDMLKSELLADNSYKTADDNVLDAQELRKKAKAELLKKPNIAKLAGDIKDLSAEKKDVQLSLFDYAGEYYRQAGVNEIELGNGEFIQIFMQAKVIKTFKNSLPGRR